MVIYEYYHEDCGKVWEESYEVLNRDLPTILVCPWCGGYGVKRSVGCGGFQLKGGGWAKSGYSKFLGDNKNFKNETWNPYDIEENL